MKLPDEFDWRLVTKDSMYVNIPKEDRGIFELSESVYLTVSEPEVTGPGKCMIILKSLAPWFSGAKNGSYRWHANLLAPDYWFIQVEGNASSLEEGKEKAEKAIRLAWKKWMVDSS